MNIDSAHYGYLTTERQKRRFYRIKKLEKAAFLLWEKGWIKTYNFTHHYFVIPFGKWYIQ
jgi:hypothetical protein